MKHVLSGDGVLIIRRSTKHLSKLLDMLGLQNASVKRTPLPTWCNEGFADGPHDEPLNADDQGVYRSCVHTTAPTRKSFVLLKHVARYCKGTAGYAPSLSPTSPGVGLRGRAASEGSSLVEIMSDSDWGASKVNHRSVSGCVCLIDSNVVASSSRTQKSISLSSCEVELLALTAACADDISS